MIEAAERRVLSTILRMVPLSVPERIYCTDSAAFRQSAAHSRHICAHSRQCS